MGRAIFCSGFIRNSAAKRWTIKGAILGAAFLVAWPAANATSQPPLQLLIAQAGSSLGKGSREEVQNIQRLLKLLSARYPAKYASVDPRRVDGVFGDDTAVAIRNFQKAAGLTSPPRNNDQLVSEILAALAQISASKPPSGTESKPKPATGTASAKTPPINSPAIPKVSAPKASGATASLGPRVTAPKTSAPEASKTPVPAKPPTVTAPTVRAPAKPKAAAAPKPKSATPEIKPNPPTPAPSKAQAGTGETTANVPPGTNSEEGRRFYFVQVASLRSSQSARREWRRIRDANRAALGAENVYFEKANIKGRGIFYRILVGPVRDRETAAVLCSLLKRNGQTCVTTRRNLSAIKDPNALIPKDPNNPDQRSWLDDDRRLAEGVGVSRPATSPAEDPTTSDRPKTESSAADSSPASQIEKSPAPPRTALKSAPNQTDSDASASSSPEQSKAELEAATRDDPATENEATDQKTEDRKKEEQEDRKVAVAPVPVVPAAPAAKTDAPTDGDSTGKSPAKTPEQATAAAPEKSTATTAVPAPPTGSATSAASPAAGSASSASTSMAVPDTAESARETTQNTEKSASSTDSRDVAIARPQTAPTTPSAAEPSDTEAKAPLINVNIQLDSWDKIAIPAGVALLIIAGVVVYGSRRRKQKSAFAQIFGTDDLSLDLGAGAAGTSETLDALEENFNSDPLRRARRIRDGFLRDVLDGELGEVTPDYSVESAMRINSELKHLLSAKPDDYKSIFLNWMFLSEVGTALNQKDIHIDQLNSDIGHELTLLQNYFKIHLLELDDRHNLRENLPGIFYCLQLPPLRQRETAAISVA